jgi:hypothetical protein
MIKFIFFSVFISLGNFCLGQDGIHINKLSAKDSISLSQTLEKYFVAIDKRDTLTIKYLSLSKVDCDMCVSSIDLSKPIASSFVNIDKFVSYLFDSLCNSKLYGYIRTSSPKIRSFSFPLKEYYYPASEQSDYDDKYFTEYEIALSLNNSSDYFYFSFKKSSNHFKLWQIRLERY